MIDKSKELVASIRLINDKLNFEGIVEGNSPISIDYTPPLGDNLGYTGSHEKLGEKWYFA